MSGLEHMRAVVSLLENRETVDVSLFGEDAGETLETKAALANARMVLDWFEGLAESPKQAQIRAEGISLHESEPTSIEGLRELSNALETASQRIRFIDTALL